MVSQAKYTDIKSYHFYTCMWCELKQKKSLKITGLQVGFMHHVLLICQSHKLKLNFHVMSLQSHIPDKNSKSCYIDFGQRLKKKWLWGKICWIGLKRKWRNIQNLNKAHGCQKKERISENDKVKLSGSVEWATI